MSRVTQGQQYHLTMYQKTARMFDEQDNVVTECNSQSCMSMWTQSRHVLCLCFKLLAYWLFDSTEGSTVIGFQGLRAEMTRLAIFSSTLQYKQTHCVTYELCWSQSWNLLDTVILVDIAMLTLLRAYGRSRLLNTP